MAFLPMNLGGGTITNQTLRVTSPVRYQYPTTSINLDEGEYIVITNPIAISAGLTNNVPIYDVTITNATVEEHDGAMYRIKVEGSKTVTFTSTWYYQPDSGWATFIFVSVLKIG